ncbi:Isochorismatase domain-containing protein [Mycena chlorophos]|uniref:Isochorismatase domain-containing protein n=1 Tax=Mycena chlorophos TaxID=658473 RepID=A0A8H6VXW4_MYCCL|nr:Isochorismatase domain-containing protein [Mycena chlorophos]
MAASIPTHTPKSLNQITNTAQPRSLRASDSILIIIDAQNEYAHGELAISPPILAASRPVIKALLERYRSAGAGIVHVVHDAPAGAPIFTPDTALAKEFDELAPLPGEITVHKRWPGAFTETTLQSDLDKLAPGQKNLVLVGYMAHVCVSTTAREGHQSGYEMFLVKDAIGDRDIPGAKADVLVEVVCAELDDAFASVITSEGII